MEAIFLVCGAGGPQLKRNPLDGATQPTMFRPVFRLLASWHLAAARRTVARYLAGDLTLDQAALPLWHELKKHGHYRALAAEPGQPGTGSLEAFSLAPDRSFEMDPGIEKLVERSWELGLGSAQYRRLKELRSHPSGPSSDSEGAV